MGWALIGHVFNAFAFALCLALHQHPNATFKRLNPLGLVGGNIRQLVIHLDVMCQSCFQIYKATFNIVTISP